MRTPATNSVGSASGRRWRRRLAAPTRAVLRLGVPALLLVSVFSVVISAPASARSPRIKKPGAPTAVTTIHTFEGAEVSWTAPVSDGGSAITGYIAKASGGGTTCTTDGATTCTMSGLKNGHKYAIFVKATNAAGAGKPSQRVFVVPGINCSLLDPDTDLQGCNFTNANLTGLNLSGSNLSNTYLTNAVLTDTDLAGADLTNANLFGITSGGIIGTPSSLPSGTSIFNGYLIGSQANLIDANLSGANLSGDNLSAANMTGSNLTSVTLSGSDLIDATLTDADLSGTVLTGATLAGVISGGITGTPTLPTGWNITDGYLCGFLANLSGVDLANVNLSGADLSGVNLLVADLDGTTLIAANLSGTSLFGTNLTIANMTDANLSGATLTDANVSNATFSNATLTGVTSGGITGTPDALPSGWSLFNGYLIGSGANLTAADLSGANLTDANLTNTDLFGANLAGATLTGVIWSNTTCPDDTNSNSDGDTCINNLTPG
jgi:uncharacterized protein YjbI with pentapeptide repeats